MGAEKVLMLLVDGIGDVTLPAFGDRTPLEVAHVPFLDAIAAAGLNGLMDPVEPGLACGSDTAHMSIFGYDPRIHYRGRGAFESMGAGIAMAPGDIAFKCNFATLDPATGVVTSRRADRNFEHLGPTLCAALDGLPLPSYPNHKVTVKYATEHRCGIAVSGPGLTDAVGGTDPLKDNLPLLRAGPEDASPEATATAGLVNELSDEIRKVLADHPINQERAAAGLAVANVVLLRGCGSRIRVPGFSEQHGMRAALVAPTKIIAGLGMSFDVRELEAPGATGFYNSAFHSKAEVICDALARGGYEFGFVHVKAVDDTGHDRRVEMKVRFQEVVDAMVGQMVRRLWEDEEASGGAVRYTIVVTGDHSTPIVFGDHSHEPVPFAIAHVRHVVSAVGGEAVVKGVKLGPIPLPDVNNPPPISQLLHQAALQDMRRKASWAGQPWVPGMPAEVFGAWREPWPQAVRGDAVRSFDELSAARGALGRFPGSQVMPTIKAFTGRPPAAAAAV
mmetsp:Transcript_32653/g.82862  ORF Transcript_32653/g.82862 Transcript_32653/m.82862 type:complete len:503 (-) Transcript_32653:247-1755(-)|eukprot:CAMPEP_0202868456 /NCGR_PEP_ID=MMETSP1391-20130828/10889_1 /ASSEMBLY_ACC=CAM_ASM_000867 /TAXON_ID=1034604 /ORGANISM="Chlamydomonas leiostraca, Strain SAG 11-49" /LENGTH=502 /DNA_ID=CAMNT_0049548631 /DNA_START=44 /DNA_END=1552 /DNA_ORIENTATION=+